MLRKFHRIAPAALVLALVGIVTPADAAPRPTAPEPTVVVVHGAFADSSGGDGVIERLRKDGYPVRAASNPLRGLAGDSASHTVEVNSSHTVEVNSSHAAMVSHPASEHGGLT